MILLELSVATISISVSFLSHHLPIFVGVKPKVFLIKLEIKGKSGNILRDLEDFPDMPMDIIYQVVARSDYYYAKTRVTLTSEDLRTALYQYTSGVRK